MTSFEIRKKFLNFFERNQHKILPSSSLIPEKDSSLLFVNAGMNQFKNVFLGLEAPLYKNVATIQKCLRAGGKHNDLEAVGETFLHHTFFEMLGNFSFGGYFKEKAIALAWEFLTEELELNSEDLWISVYEKDKESYEIWRSGKKIPENKIYQLGKKDNFWQMGDTGPCGPCTEIHYYKGEEKKPDPRQFMEIWNLVFMEFYDTEKGIRKKLSVPCVDTGMGLERLCSLLQNKKSNYHTDLFLEIILSLEKACSCKYDFSEKHQTDKQKAFRVLADHSRAVSLLIADGVVTGNDRESYVLRRIIRRALYYSEKLDPENNLLQLGVEKTISLMADTYPSLKQEEKNIQSLIQRETELFSESLKTGRKKLEETMKSLSEKFIPAQTVWNLYSTYGFPKDLTRLIAQEEGWAVAKEEDIKKYEKKGQHEFKETGAHIEIKDFIKQYGPQLSSVLRKKGETETVFTGYERNEEKGRILLISSIQRSEGIKKMGEISPQLSLKALAEEQEAWLVLDKSCFYPEGGGPIGDRGFLETETGRAEILDCQKEGGFIWHKLKMIEGEITEGQTCQMLVNMYHRREVSASHTATHLLNSALRSILGKSVRQAGSLVEPGRLRFDFTHPRALTDKECHCLEEQIWQSIEEKELLSSSFKSLEQAKQEGALFLQGENYDQKVRVVSIGEQSSKELCAGIHIQNTREIRSFKILSEKGIQSGVRRIVAYTGSLALAWESFLLRQNIKLREYLKLSLPGERKKNSLFFEKENLFWRGSIEKQNPFLSWLENQEKNLKVLRKKIIHLEKAGEFSPSADPEFVPIKSRIHPLSLQNLELREHLKWPLPKVEGLMDFFLRQSEPEEMSSVKKWNLNKLTPQIQEIKEQTFPKEQEIQKAEDFFEDSETLLDSLKNKEKELKNLYNQWRRIKNLGFTKNNFLERAKDFQIKGLKGKLLVLLFPLQDRKILSDMSDFLVSKLSCGVLVLLGEGEGKHPVLVRRTKDFEKLLSAGDILKNTIAPLCKGQGGGKDSFAQGSIRDRSAFSNVEQILLKKWSEL